MVIKSLKGLKVVKDTLNEQQIRADLEAKKLSVGEALQRAVKGNFTQLVADLQKTAKDAAENAIKECVTRGSLSLADGERHAKFRGLTFLAAEFARDRQCRQAA